MENTILGDKWGENMIILGIDPGIAITGYGVLEQNGNRFKPIEYGVIRSGKEMDTPERLRLIHTGLTEIIEKFQPEHMAIEQLFFNKNVKTALTVGHARGVVMLTACLRGMIVSEYTPLQVKQAVVGYGRADKKQVQYMVKSILNLDKIPKPDDAADALAIAICHGNSFNSLLRAY